MANYHRELLELVANVAVRDRSYFAVGYEPGTDNWRAGAFIIPGRVPSFMHGDVTDGLVPWDELTEDDAGELLKLDWQIGNGAPEVDAITRLVRVLDPLAGTIYDDATGA